MSRSKVVGALNEVRISGIKSLKETAIIPIRPLTFLVGPNSAGKSAVLHAISFARRFWDYTPKRQGYEASFSFDLGDDDPETPELARLRYRPNHRPTVREGEVLSVEFDLAVDKRQLQFRLYSALQREDERPEVLGESSCTITAGFRVAPRHDGPVSYWVHVSNGILIEHSLEEYVIDASDAGGIVQELLADCAGRLAQLLPSNVSYSNHRLALPHGGWVSGRRTLETWILADILVSSSEVAEADRLRITYEADLLIEELDELHRAITEVYSRAICDVIDFAVVSGSRHVPTDEELTYVFSTGPTDPRASHLSHRLFGVHSKPVPEFYSVARAATYAAIAQDQSKGSRLISELFGNSRDQLHVDEAQLRLKEINDSLSGDLFVDRFYQVSADYYFVISRDDIHVQNARAKRNKAKSSGSLDNCSILISTLRLQDAQGRLLSFNDVGAGLGYVLPVLLSVFENRFTFLQQPELHLHPALQANLADVLISSLVTRGHHIVETHSEHLLLRTLKRIRQATKERGSGNPPTRPNIDAEDVAVMYFDPSP